MKKVIVSFLYSLQNRKNKTVKEIKIGYSYQSTRDWIKWELYKIYLRYIKKLIFSFMYSLHSRKSKTVEEMKNSLLLLGYRGLIKVAICCLQNVI